MGLFDHRIHGRAGWMASSCLALAALGLPPGLLAAETPAPAAAGTAAGEVKAAEAKADVVGFVTMNYRHVTLGRVLEYIGKAANKNILIRADEEKDADELRNRPINVILNRVPWRTALDHVAKEALRSEVWVDVSKESEGVLYVEKQKLITYTSKAEGEELLNLLKLFEREVNLSFTVDPNLDDPTSKGKETIKTKRMVVSWKKTPWRVALEGLLDNCGLVMIERNGVYVITTQEVAMKATEPPVIKIRPLRFIQPYGSKFDPTLEYKKIVERSRKSSKVEMVGSGAQSKTTTTEPARSVTLVEMVSSMVTPGLTDKDGNVLIEAGRVSYEERSNSIIIRDYKDQVNQIMKLIDELDQEPKQVKIDVKMLSTSLSDAKITGIRWGNSDTGVSLGASSTSKWATLWPFSIARTNSGESSKFGGLNDMGPLNPITVNSANEPVAGYVKPLYVDNTAGNLGAPIVGTVNLNADVNANLMRYAGSGKITQAPQLVTLDHQEAMIKVGRIIRYAEQEVSSSGSSTSSGWVEAENSPIETGIHLSVIPHVCGDGKSVLLEVLPKSVNYIGLRDYSSGGAVVLQLPETSERIVYTKMMLGSQETGVIGGLIEDSEDRTERKIPVLGDIPVVGYLFKQTTKGTVANPASKTELTVFITPTILSTETKQGFDDQLEEARNLAAAYSDEEPKESMLNAQMTE